jgi:hypothetical protein
MIFAPRKMRVRVTFLRSSSMLRPVPVRLDVRTSYSERLERAPGTSLIGRVLPISEAAGRQNINGAEGLGAP